MKLTEGGERTYSLLQGPYVRKASEQKGWAYLQTAKRYCPIPSLQYFGVLIRYPILLLCNRRKVQEAFLPSLHKTHLEIVLQPWAGLPLLTSLLPSIIPQLTAVWERHLFPMHEPVLGTWIFHKWIQTFQKLLTHFCNPVSRIAAK